MRFELKTPCKNCPFRTDETGIRFACRSRAEEIAESAYRNGFPCHLSAEYQEEDGYGESGGFVEGANSQHCIGHAIMLMKQGETCWPGVNNDEDLVEALWSRIDEKAPVFESEEDFLEANDG